MTEAAEKDAVLSEDEIRGNSSLWRRLSQVRARSAHLLIQMEGAVEHLRPLDGYGHDQVLAEDDPVLREVQAWDPVRTAIAFVVDDLRHSIRHMEEAQRHIEGLLRRDLKDRYEGLLDRGVKSGQDKLAKFEQLYAEHLASRRPFELRRNKLASLVSCVKDVADKLRELRTDSRGASTELVGVLEGPNRELYRIRAALAKLRDNPSQKMATTLQCLHDEAKSVHSWLGEIVECIKQFAR